MSEAQISPRPYRYSMAAAMKRSAAVSRQKPAGSRPCSQRSPMSASMRFRWFTRTMSSTPYVRSLLPLDGALVWVNPIHEGRNRANLDALLRDVASRGVWVSAHPDVILKMGTKEVLHRTRSMSWGSDTALYQTVESMRAELPASLAAGPRVIKRNRGNGGQGMWKVEALSGSPHRPMARVLDATKDKSEEMPLDEFIGRCAEYFEDDCVIDQPFQARLKEGVVRCYMAGDRCAGFGHQKVKALVDEPAARAEAGRRLYTSNADPRFQRLRQLMEDEWMSQLTSLLDITRHELPMIWDADFMLGATAANGTDSYVLGEINVSSVFPDPRRGVRRNRVSGGRPATAKPGMVWQATRDGRNRRAFLVKKFKQGGVSFFLRPFLCSI